MNHGMQSAGQALLELALFGAMLLLVLGVLINYGLNADYTQQSTMRAFREELRDTDKQATDHTPSSISVLTLEDRNLADPSNPFAVGQSVLVLGSASGVVRNYRLQETADTVEELPRQLITVGTQEINCPSASVCLTACVDKGNAQDVCARTCRGCTTAGFRTEHDVPLTRNGQPVKLKDRYLHVYGRNNVNDDQKKLGPGRCLDPPPQPPTCQNPSVNLKILDSCEGEMLSYDACYKQALMLVDNALCKRECQRENGAAQDCTMCDVRVEESHRPWYARGAIDPAYSRSKRWEFPALDQMRDLGLQPAYTRRTAATNRLSKTETPSGGRGVRSDIRTVTDVQVQETTARSFVYNEKSLDYVARPLQDNPGARTDWKPSQRPCRSAEVALGKARTDVFVNCNDVEGTVDWETVGR